MTGVPDVVEERIQSYLDEVLLAARGRPREVRWLLAEVETHLRDSVDAGIAAGLDPAAAVDVALERFGPPAGVVRGSSWSTYRTVAAQVGEAALLLMTVLCLAVGLASIPDAVIALAGGSDLVTGATFGQPLSTAELAETVRNHLLGGVVGFVGLMAWWTLRVRRRARPVILPTWFASLVCGISLLAVAAVFLGVGILNLAQHIDAVAGGVVGAGDLMATGATIAAVAVLCWLAWGIQVTRRRHWMPQRGHPDLP